MAGETTRRSRLGWGTSLIARRAVTGTRAWWLALATVVAAVSGAAGVASTYAAFSTSRTNDANSFKAGTVSLTDNDGGSAMLSLTSALPGASDTGCVEVTYTGSLTSTFRLFASVTGSLAPYLTLTVTRGTDSMPSFDSCTNFTPDGTNYIGAGAGVIYSGLLSGFPTSYAAGVIDPVAGFPESWTSGEKHAYKFVVSLNNDVAAEGLSSTATFVWEARNE